MASRESMIPYYFRMGNALLSYLPRIGQPLRHCPETWSQPPMKDDNLTPSLARAGK